MDNIRFGKFIRESRQAKGLTQKQLAEQIHVSDKAVSKWENGAGFPDIKILEPLAQCLDVSLLELMQSERMAQPQIDREEAQQIVVDTIFQIKAGRRVEEKDVESQAALGGLCLRRSLSDLRGNPLSGRTKKRNGFEGFLGGSKRRLV